MIANAWPNRSVWEHLVVPRQVIIWYFTPFKWAVWRPGLHPVAASRPLMANQKTMAPTAKPVTARLILRFGRLLVFSHQHAPRQRFLRQIEAESHNFMVASPSLMPLYRQQTQHDSADPHISWFRRVKHASVDGEIMTKFIMLPSHKLPPSCNCWLRSGRS